MSQLANRRSVLVWVVALTAAVVLVMVLAPDRGPNRNRDSRTRIRRWRRRDAPGRLPAAFGGALRGIRGSGRFGS